MKIRRQVCEVRFLLEVSLSQSEDRARMHVSHVQGSWFLPAYVHACEKYTRKIFYLRFWLFKFEQYIWSCCHLITKTKVVMLRLTVS